MARVQYLLDRVPPAFRPPLVAGGLVFAVAVSTTQVALYIQSQNSDAQIQAVGRVYVGGLLATIRPAIDAGDRAGIGLGFERAVTEQHGVIERGLFAFDAAGHLLSRYGDPSLSEGDARTLAYSPRWIDQTNGVIWVARSLAEGSQAAVVAALDISDALAARRRLHWTIVLSDVLLAALCGCLTFLFLRRVNRPLLLLTRRLREAETSAPQPLPLSVLPPHDEEMLALYRAYNRMVDTVQDRERLLHELAEREQSAALGRLSATIAHEIRNPLGGLAAAVSTLKGFGDNAAVRRDALDLLERGVATLAQIVATTLELYRPQEGRHLTRSDLEDLRYLIVPEAEKRGTKLTWTLQVPEELTVDAGSIRQILLNLLLNACAANERGGVVSLRVWTDSDGLLCEVTDQGPGLDPPATEALLNGEPVTLRAPGSPNLCGLGLSIVVRLLRRLGARAQVSSEPGQGATIRVKVPLERQL
jgi:signal transduction histidine kinase